MRHSRQIRSFSIPFLKRFFLNISISIGLLLLIIIFVRFVIDRRVKHLIKEETSSLQFDDVEITLPFNIKIKGLSINGREGSTIIPSDISVRIKELLLYPSFWSIIKGEIEIDAIRIYGADLKVWMEKPGIFLGFIGNRIENLDKIVNNQTATHYRLKKILNRINRIIIRDTKLELSFRETIVKSVGIREMKGEIDRNHERLEGRLSSIVELILEPVVLKSRCKIQFVKERGCITLSLSTSLENFPSVAEVLLSSLDIPIRVYDGKVRFLSTMRTEKMKNSFFSRFSFEIESMSIFSPYLSVVPAEGLDLSFEGELWTEDGFDSIIMNLPEIRLNSIYLSGDGKLLDLKAKKRFTLNVYTPLLNFQDIFDSIPADLLSRNSGFIVDGGLALYLWLEGRLGKPLDLIYDFDWKVDDPVALSCGTEFDYLNQPFVHTFYDEDGNRREMVMGLSNPDWTPLSVVPESMIHSLLVTEDINFFNHRGFDFEELKYSIKKDLKEKGFKRGGSTITQQLSKNLFLSGDKTIMRKIEEFIITSCLEKNLSKKRILELYLNLIEWGPGIYGISQASHHYFGKSVSELDLLESVFLSSIIPSPSKYYTYYLNGKISENWQKRMEDILDRMLHYEFISLEEYYNALGRELAFRPSRSTTTNYEED